MSRDPHPCTHWRDGFSATTEQTGNTTHEATLPGAFSPPAKTATLQHEDVRSCRSSASACAPPAAHWVAKFDAVPMHAISCFKHALPLLFQPRRLELRVKRCKRCVMVMDGMGRASVPCQPIQTALKFQQATPALRPTSGALPLVRCVAVPLMTTRLLSRRHSKARGSSNGTKQRSRAAEPKQTDDVVSYDP